jgi:hypothetical protein
MAAGALTDTDTQQPSAGGVTVTNAPAGAGQTLISTSTTTASWQPGMLSVKAFGAAGNGVNDDTTAIQAALNAAAESNAVFVPPGIYIVSRPLTMLAGTLLAGAGNGAAVLRAKAGTNLGGNLLQVNANRANYSVTIRDVQLDGNSPNGASVTNGIYLFAPSDCLVEGVRIVQVSGNSLQLDGSATYLGTANKVVNSFVRACGGHGFLTTAFCTDTQLTGDDFGSCSGAAFYLGGAQAALAGCIGWGCGVGLDVASSSGETWVVGCRFDSNEYDGVDIAGPNVTLTGCYVENNSCALTDAHDGISVASTASDVSIVGCRSVGAFQISQNQRYGINVAPGRSGPVTIVGNDVTGNATGGIDLGGTYETDTVLANTGSTVTTVPVLCQTATTATAGTAGAAPPQVAGYLLVNVGGTTGKIAYYNA